MIELLDKPLQEDCGVAGVMAPKGYDAAPIAAAIASDLQHRGQEGSGLGVKPFDLPFRVRRASTRFGSAFAQPALLAQLHLEGEVALAHTRYRTAGPADDVDYAHPFEIQTDRGSLIGVINGNVVNVPDLHEELKSRGIKLQTDGKTTPDGKPLPPSDSEIILTRVAHAPGTDWTEKIARGMEGVQGSTSAVIATDDDKMIAWTDQWRVRPLVYGRVADRYWAASSESTPLDEMGAMDIHDVQKGQIVVFEQGKDPNTITYDNSQKCSNCTFEDWYFSWPASRRNGYTMSQVRELAGFILAEEEELSGRRVSADLVTAIPDTGRSGGVVFAQRLGIPYADRIFKKRYDDKGNRGFLGSTTELRSLMMERKYSIDYSVRGQILYVLDDSIVRGETTNILSKTLRERYGAKEIHYRILSPKIVRPCYLGVNINSREELGAVEFKNGVWVIKSNEQIAKEIGADSVAFLSINGVKKLRDRLGERVEDFCSYCHGEPGPNLNWLQYDPEINREHYLRDYV